MFPRHGGRKLAEVVSLTGVPGQAPVAVSCYSGPKRRLTSAMSICTGLYEEGASSGLSPECSSGSAVRRTVLRRLRLSRSAAAARASLSAFFFPLSCGFFAMA